MLPDIGFNTFNVGRGGEIRTPDPLVPNQMRYQAALRPELQNLYVINFQKQVNVLNISIIKCLTKDLYMQ